MSIIINLINRNMLKLFNRKLSSKFSLIQFQLAVQDKIYAIFQNISSDVNL